ncbi:MAG TPA: 16S rRNA (adenine(1518)-N(6)/adenine(1519)-N(6))-dimethyltransferase RsmA [Casimicrobiaceae bacterium]|nr:16S rRNA (adenine(1518)-N(6)/adenine(1519)-N(6))-dimethyltransferase RsmA [Casimicrobiaceae bacterium]
MIKGHWPRKRFGQHFLVDPHYIARIVDAIDPRPGDNIVEIGPGLGALTGALFERAGRVAAIEIDRDLAARLRDRFDSDRLALNETDALTFDFATLGDRLRVAGNLPYNISSPLLFHLASFDAQLRDVHVMLQREVVARMTAAPGTPDYGRLTVMLQTRFAVSRLFTVPAGAFRPAPKVESAVARLVPLGESRPAIVDEALFARVVSAAFGQRRKTLRNALSSIADEATLRNAGIDPGARGEALAVADFVRLANMLARHSIAGGTPQ